MQGPDATIVAAVISGVAVIVVNTLVTLRSGSKTQGKIEATMSGISARQDRHEAEVEKKFDSVDKEQDQQWSTINRHTSEIAYLQGKANGKHAPARS